MSKPKFSCMRIPIEIKQELPLRKQICPRPSGFELNQYGQECTPVMYRTELILLA